MRIDMNVPMDNEMCTKYLKINIVQKKHKVNKPVTTSAVGLVSTSVYI